MGNFIAATLFAFAFIGQAVAGEAGANQEWEKAQVIGMVPIHQAYRNVQYGFSVPIVGGKMYRPAAPNPNHGVLILLGNQRTISISAEYDAAEYGSTTSQLDHWLENEHPDSVKREDTMLAGKPAEEAILQASQVVTMVIAQRRDERGGILYELTLTTTLAHQNEDSAIFDNLAHSFKTYALP